VAGELGARSIAFPGISTGIFGYPAPLAADVAVAAARAALPGASAIEEIVFCAFSDADLALYRQLL